MARKSISTDTKVQAVLHAAVHGDASASKAFDVTDRALRKWRDEARTDGTDCSELFRSYAAALNPDRRATDFADWLLRRVEQASDILVDKARAVSTATPEGLRAINEHVATLLEHAAALEYIASLFGADARSAGGETGDRT